MRREACPLWITPFDAALAICRTACASSCFTFAGSPEVAASRNFRTLLRSVERTCALRTRCFWAWRFCFSADRVLATKISENCREKAPVRSKPTPECQWNSPHRLSTLPIPTRGGRVGSVTRSPYLLGGTIHTAGMTDVLLACNYSL